MALETVDLTPSIGSELKVSKGQLLSGELREDIRALLVRRGAVVIRGVHPSDEELRQIARTLGELRTGSVKRGADG
jgi:hypothetical protein